MNQLYNDKKGLLPLPKDIRDFSHSRVFGSVATNDLPIEDFLVETPLEIKNQDINYFSDFCAVYAGTEVSEDQEGIVGVPEYSFAKAYQILGISPIGQFGLNLRDACNAFYQYGYLPRTHDPFACNTVNRPPRDFIATYTNWPKELDAIAAQYKEASYFAVDGPHDMFDNLRSVMANNLSYRKSIITGCIWRQSWTMALGGIIPETYETNGTAHAFKIFGQKIINGIIYLVAQLSDGELIGDNGKFYFPRSVVNAEFTFGAFTFQNIPKEEAIWHIANSVQVNDGNFTRIAKFFIATIRRVINVIHVS